MKRNLLAFVLVCGFAAVVVASVEPTAKIVETANPNAAYQWVTDDLWVGGHVPTNADDVISLSYGDGSKRLILVGPKGPTALDSICDCNPNTHFRLDVWYVSNVMIPYRIAIRQLSGFNGFWPINFQYNGNWAGCGPDVGFDFLGTREDPTVVNAIHGGTLPAFGVPAEDGLAKIRRYYRGMFRKDGAGELVMDGVVGGDTGAYLESGTLTLNADSTDVKPLVATNPAVWFDATNPDIQFETVGGRQFVVDWPSSGELTYKAVKPIAPGGWGPTPSGNTEAGLPWLSAATANGKRLIDFGRYTQYNVDDPDPDDSAGQLLLTVNQTGIKEVFYAVEVRPGVSGNSVPILANSSDQTFNLNASTNRVMAMGGNDYIDYGDLRVNGRPWVSADDDNDPFRMRVVSMKLGADKTAAFNRFGGWANAKTGGRGGFRFGEMLAYTRELTETERRQTIAYLMDRWLDARFTTEKLGLDFGNLVAKGGTAKISVPTNQLSRVHRLVQGPTNEVGVVKTGAGTLNVERLSPVTAALTVAEGKVKLVDELGTVSADGPIPANPVAHFDATDADSFEFASNNYVSAWHDVRPGVDLVATNIVDMKTTKEWCFNPIRVEKGSPSGLTTVDFKTDGVSWSYPRAPRLKFNREVEMVEGYIVWKNDRAAGVPPMIFCGTTGVDFGTRKINCLLNRDNVTCRLVPGADWAVNGIPCDPYNTDFGAMGGEDEWVVVRYSGTSSINTPTTGARLVAKVDAMAIAGGRVTSCYGGGCQIGEMIVYDRELTDRERRETEAYLMKRWLGKAHPDNEAWRGRLSFAPGATAEIETDQDIAPVELVTESSSFGKSGAGKMSVGRMPTNVTDITVGEGGFSASLFASDALYQMTLDAAWHFDASDPTSFEMTEDAAGDLRISRWFDVRRNGKYASANLVNCRAKPTYSVATEAGLLEGLPYVDFGPYSPCPRDDGYMATNELTAAMNLSEADASVMEVHVVWCDKFTNRRAVFPLGRYADQGGFVRDNNKVLARVYNNMLIDTRLEGTTVDQEIVKPAGFGVVSLVVTGCVTTAFTAANVDTIACDRRLNAGGVKIAEIIIYDTVQSAEKRAAIDAELLAKWRGIGTRTRVAGPAVSVASGTTASFTEADNVVFSSVSGAGTFEADVLNLPEDFAHTVAFDAAGGCTQLKTGGDLTLPESATLTLSFPDGFKPQTDRAYRIIDAAALVGAENIANWSVVNPLGAKREVRLSVDAASGDVLLQFSAPGMMLLFR